MGMCYLLSSHLVAGLRASGLHCRQTIIISGNGIVMFNALLGATLFVDFHQRQRWRVVLYQPHLRRHCHHSGHWRHGGRRRTKTGCRWGKYGEGRAKAREKKRWGSRGKGKERSKGQCQWHINCRHLVIPASKESLFYHNVKHSSKPTTEILQSWETAALKICHFSMPSRARECKSLYMTTQYTQSKHLHTLAMQTKSIPAIPFGRK